MTRDDSWSRRNAVKADRADSSRVVQGAHPSPSAPFTRIAPGSTFARAAEAAHDAHATEAAHDPRAERAGLDAQEAHDALAALTARVSSLEPAPATPAPPKYARYEHERRWLIPASAEPIWRPLARPYAHKLSDRYLICGRLRLRCLTRTDTNEITYKLTKKYPWSDPLARPLTTLYLTSEEHAALAVLPARQLVKTRYFVEYDRVRFSIDVFEGALAGLTIAECECTDAGVLRSIRAPHWAGREVTDDLAFTCAALATLPAGSTVPR